MRKIILFLFVLSLVHEAIGQNPFDSMKHQALYLGVGINQVKEANLMPTVHSGSIYNLTYSWYKQTKNVSLFDAAFSYSRPKSQFEGVSTSVFANFIFGYSYLFDVAMLNGKISQQFGPKASLEADICYYPTWDDSHLYWANDLNAGIRDMISYQISPNKTLICDVEVGLLSLFSRPSATRQYKYDDYSAKGIVESFTSNLELGTVASSLNMECSLEYLFKLNPNFAQSIFYRYKYRMLDSKVSEKYTNSIHLVGLRFYFL